MRRFIIALVGLLVGSVALAQTPVCVVGLVGAAPTAKLSFTPITTNTDGTPVATPVSYNLYQSTTPGAEVKVASALAGSPISVTTGLLPKTTYYWKVSVVDTNGVESALSNEVCKAFPASVPGAVTITIS